MSRPDAPEVKAPPPLLVGVLALAGIVVSLQQTLVIPLIPQFPRLLGADAADTAWVVTATLLAAAVATPIVGRLADMVGKRRMMLVCLVVLVVGSVVGALSTSLVPLVVGRALQGLATGVVPLGISLMRDHLPAERLSGATALMSASLGVGGALGLPLSALVAQYADWHVLFWAAGGVGAVITALVVAIVPESPERAGGRFDLVGALAFSVALVCLLLAISKGATWGWGSALTVGLFVAAVVLLLAWGAWELRTSEPLVDLRVSARRQVLLTNVASAVFGFSMFAMSLVFPQLLQLPEATGYGLGQSIVVAGLVLAPGGLCMIVMSPVSARITNASGPRTTLMLGAVVVAAGYILGCLLHAAVWQLVIVSVVISSGIGLAYGAMPSLIMAAVPVHQTASGNSLNNLMRAVGTSTASALAGVLLAQLTTTLGGAKVPTEFAFVLVMILGAAAAVVALVITAFIPPRRAAPAVEAMAVEPQRVEPAAASTAPLVTGRIAHADGRAASEAVVTVISTGGAELGRTRADPTGRYSVHRAADGSPHLLVTRADGVPHVQTLAAGAPTVDVEIGRRAPRRRHRDGGAGRGTDRGRASLTGSADDIADESFDRGALGRGGFLVAGDLTGLVDRLGSSCVSTDLLILLRMSERITVSLADTVARRVRQCGERTRGGASGYLERLVREDELREALKAHGQWFDEHPGYETDARDEAVAVHDAPR